MPPTTVSHSRPCPPWGSTPDAPRSPPGGRTGGTAGGPRLGHAAPGRPRPRLPQPFHPYWLNLLHHSPLPPSASTPYVPQSVPHHPARIPGGAPRLVRPWGEQRTTNPLRSGRLPLFHTNLQCGHPWGKKFSTHLHLTTQKHRQPPTIPPTSQNSS